MELLLYDPWVPGTNNACNGSVGYLKIELARIGVIKSHTVELVSTIVEFLHLIVE